MTRGGSVRAGSVEVKAGRHFSSRIIWCSYRVSLNMHFLVSDSGSQSHCCVYSYLAFCVSQTQLMYKWIEPKTCNETIKGAVKLPASGEKNTCPPCNPGFFVTNSTCEPCTDRLYSNGTGAESVHYLYVSFM